MGRKGRRISIEDVERRYIRLYDKFFVQEKEKEHKIEEINNQIPRLKDFSERIDYLKKEMDEYSKRTLDIPFCEGTKVADAVISFFCTIKQRNEYRRKEAIRPLSEQLKKVLAVVKSAFINITGNNPITCKLGDGGSLAVLTRNVRQMELRLYRDYPDELDNIQWDETAKRRWAEAGIVYLAPASGEAFNEDLHQVVGEDHPGEGPTVAPGDILACAQPGYCVKTFDDDCFVLRKAKVIVALQES